MREKAVRCLQGRASVRGLFLPFLLSLLLTANWTHAAPPGALKQIFKDNAPAVVLIRFVDAAGKTVSIGSGFVVSPSGVIVTNHHVIEPKPGARLAVKLPNGDVYDDVWVINADDRRDFAVLLIKASGLPTVKLGNSDKMEVGDEVVAIGNPKGLELTFTSGIVSAVRPDPRKGYRFIQHQAPISPGSSGGPLLNMNGEVIGINTFFFEGGQNLNGAVPVNYVKPYLQDPPKMTYEQYARGVPPAEVRAQPAPSAAWKTYHNEKYEIEFKYPADWKFLEFEEWEKIPDPSNSVHFAKLGLPVTGRGIVRWTVWRQDLLERWIVREGGRIDFENTARNLYKGLESVHARDRTRSVDFLAGDGYGGFYWVSTNDSENRFSINASIVTRSYVYLHMGTCTGSWAQDPNCERLFSEIFKSFKFPK